VINIVVGHEVHTFLVGFSKYHHISIPLKNQYKIVFVTLGGGLWIVMLFGVKNGSPTYLREISKAFHEYIDVFSMTYLPI
jgi:hypothetical protein